MSVDVPLLVPLIATVAPGKVSFVSAAVIKPVIGRDCAYDCTTEPMVSNSNIANVRKAVFKWSDRKVFIILLVIWSVNMIGRRLSLL